MAAHTFTEWKVLGLLFSLLHLLTPLSMTSKKYWKYRFILYLLHIDCWIPTLLFFHEYCISSSLYQVDIFRATFVPALALSPSWVPILITPSFFVIIAGSLSPISQHWPSVVVKRKSSAHPASPMKLSSSKEWMHKSKETLKAGPQVGSVASRLSWLTGSPTKIICHAFKNEGCQNPPGFVLLFLLLLTVGAAVSSLEQATIVSVIVFIVRDLSSILFHCHLFVTFEPFLLVWIWWWVGQCNVLYTNVKIGADAKHFC